MDDYAMMYELLRRHLRRRGEVEDLPDLLVLDGGKGQLGVALAVREELDLKGVDAVALAKGRGLDREDKSEQDRVFLPGRKEAISLRRDPAALRVLQHVRDEAHRFALTHHRKRRDRKRMASPLDDIPGVGPARKRALLKHLGSMRRTREATMTQLAHVPGISEGLARRIFEGLKKDEMDSGLRSQETE